METQIIKHGDKVIVKFNQSEPSRKTVLKWQKQLDVKLSYLAHRNGGLILWSGEANIKFAACPTHRRTEMAKKLQSLYSKIRYAKKWSSRAYEAVVRPHANGETMVNFITPNLP